MCATTWPTYAYTHLRGKSISNLCEKYSNNCGQVNVTAKPTKCPIGYKEIKFVGFIVGKGKYKAKER